MSEIEPQPKKFDYARFRTQLTMLSLELFGITREFEQAMRVVDESQIATYSVKKRQIVDAIFICLGRAYLETDGEVMHMPEFDSESGGHFDLQLPYRGHALWVEVGRKLEEWAKDAEESTDIEGISDYVEYEVIDIT
ncbi:hypothetical protein ACFL3C_02605 [Patescibacteria group bacterium]